MREARVWTARAWGFGVAHCEAAFLSRRRDGGATHFDEASTERAAREDADARGPTVVTQKGVRLARELERERVRARRRERVRRAGRGRRRSVGVSLHHSRRAPETEITGSRWCLEEGKRGRGFEHQRNGGSVDEWGSTGDPASPSKTVHHHASW